MKNSFDHEPVVTKFNIICSILNTYSFLSAISLLVSFVLYTLDVKS